MQIAIITSEIGESSGGLSYSCLTFSKMLEGFGYNITVITSTYSNCKELFNSSGFPLILNKVNISEGGYKKKLKNHLFFRAHIHNVIEETKNKKFDYVISFGAGFNGLFASELSSSLKVKLLVLLRGSEINLSISDYKLRDANFQCLKSAFMVIALSKELLERSKAIYFNASLIYKVIPNSIKYPAKTFISKIDRKTIVLGCGSTNLNEKKGVANLISMISFLNLNPNRSFKIEFVGNIDFDLLSNYMELCRKLKVTDFVEFIGKVSREDFIERMKSWDFYVQGSFCEGFSNSVGDYLSLGKAFVISNSGFIAETIKQTSPEIVFEDYSPQNMANKILALINNPNISAIYINAYNSISSTTNVDNIKTIWRNIFENHHYPIPNINNQNNILSVVFHDISKDDFSNIDTPLDAFVSFVDKVFHKGYRLCSVNQFFKSGDRSNLIVCTFDDAYSGIILNAMPVLKKYSFTATVFVCYDYIGKTNDWNLKDLKVRRHLNISELQMLKTENWEIGSHGLTHNSLLRLSDDDLFKELQASKFNLEKLFNDVETYAYPYGDFNEYIKSQATQIFKSAFALTKGGTLIGIDNHQIRRYFISELDNILNL